VGIIPDIWLAPTIAGLRAGRDELIDAAIRHIRASSERNPPREPHRPEPPGRRR
jgi:hypothetical protein